MKNKNIDHVLKNSKGKNLCAHQKLIALLISGIVLLTMIFAAYLYRYHSIKLFSADFYVTEMKNWMKKERGYLQNKSTSDVPNKQKRLASSNKNSEDLSVQFEFYDALPSMHVTIPTVTKYERRQDASLKKEKNLAPPMKLFDAEKLKREFARNLR